MTFLSDICRIMYTTVQIEVLNSRYSLVPVIFVHIHVELFT